MRKLLLASAAVLGVSWGMSDLAHAQSTPTSATPTPGNVVVRLNGRMHFYAGYAVDQNFQTAGYKGANYDFFEYARLYPGFDGIAANGLKYGAALEIRQDHNTVGAIASPTSASFDHGALYFRRVAGYIGTNTLGTLRFGSTDNPSSLYITGTLENFNSGAWNGDAPSLLVGNAQLIWPFADVGNLYTTGKVVYLSNQYFGFDGGISYEPDTNNLTSSQGCSYYGASSIGVSNSATTTSGGCATLSSAPDVAALQRRRNTWNPLIRYRGTFGPIGVAATGAWIVSSKINDSASGFSVNSSGVGPALVAAPNKVEYDGLDVGDFGGAVTFGGLSVAGHYQYGRVNNQWSLDPKGAPDMTAWTAGASYTIGPFIFGASWIDIVDAGVQPTGVSSVSSTGVVTPGVGLVGANLGHQRQQGFAAGGTYSVAPGIAVFFDYLWDERRQAGVNMVTNAINPVSAYTLNNKEYAQAMTIGTGFAW